MKFTDSPFHKEVQAVLAAIRANDSDAPMALAFIDYMSLADKRTLLREAPALLDELGRARVACTQSASTKEEMEVWIDAVTS